MSYKYSHRWEKFANDYDKNISSKFESRIYKIEENILTNIFHRYWSKDSQILDFACWTWRITSFIKSQYPNIVGYDISDEMLMVANKKYKNISFYKKDILNERIIDKFDIITSFRFFLNAEYDLKKDILLSLYNLLDKNGIIIFNIHMNKLSIAFLLTRIKYLLWLTNIKQKWMSYMDVQKLLEETWYKIDYSIGYSFLLWNPLLVFLPSPILYYIDNILSKISILKIFSKDIIFVIKKKND